MALSGPQKIKFAGISIPYFHRQSIKIHLAIPHRKLRNNLPSLPTRLKRR